MSGKAAGFGVSGSTCQVDAEHRGEGELVVGDAGVTCQLALGLDTSALLHCGQPVSADVRVEDGRCGGGRTVANVAAA